MNDLITTRLYFEYGHKVNHESFWKKIASSGFSTELMKRAKSFGLHHLVQKM